MYRVVMALAKDLGASNGVMNATGNDSL
jgi:hypothetical protein